ncbi:mannosyl-oligosaccharide alpha-1,2-mannosidase [Sphingomonas palmae]|uniref:Mannosyl-oligosaccharide alpha-1,2-mannosidase n=1 Tax=Sphingomonas palmae TaxID=1855283 RepID=A0A1H7RNB6_9SPHN|nr:glycoside hydrolase family 47 protein [Sphingomonas palmae]SEL61314.1 mannosyl-oligosaccharide alpha-1,2-mannosidase [Sphingomonas palmae]
MNISRRTILGIPAGLVAAGVSGRAEANAGTDWHALADDVRSQMAWAWDQYRQRAWGKDEIKPVSGTFSSFPLKTHHLGLSLIEALDTLWLMGLDTRFQDGVDWVKASFDADVDGEVSVFETSIRLVGGLLSAHLACGDAVLLAKARDLADRLLPAFATPTGMPYRFVNLRTGVPREPVTSPADIATYLPEWGTLSRLTGDPRYTAAARRAMVAVFERRSPLDLVATKINVLTGEWQSRTATVGSYCDSFFEYLWDGWQLFGDAACKRMYDTCTAAILKHQQVWKDGNLWIADVDFETGAVVSTEQDELASFYGGLLGQGGAFRQGAAYTESWAKVQARYGVLPEGYDYAAAKPTQVTNALRPELVDAAFNLWLIDRDPRWREIGRLHFEAMKRWNRAPFGYTDLADVTASPKRQADHCPGYWWSEQMKYYYLLFSDTPRFDYRDNYLSTEGNVLKGFRRDEAQGARRRSS